MTYQFAGWVNCGRPRRLQRLRLMAPRQRNASPVNLTASFRQFHSSGLQAHGQAESMEKGADVLPEPTPPGGSRVLRPEIPRTAAQYAIAGGGGTRRIVRRAKRSSSAGRSVSAHHSQRSPWMSYKPQALGFFMPTGWIADSALPWYQAYSPNLETSSPEHHWVVLPARHAYSHWASVGRRNVPPCDVELVVELLDERLAVVPAYGVDRVLRTAKALELLPITASHWSCMTLYLPM